MKNLFLIIALIITSVSSFADHINGYEMSLVNIKTINGNPTDSYKLAVKLYRINESSSAQLGNMISFSTIANGTNANTNLNVNLTIVSKYLVPANSSICNIPNANENLEVGVYEGIVTAVQVANLSNASGYYFLSTTCCQSGFMNFNFASFGYVYTMDFPRLTIGSVTRFNSSPKFNTNPTLSYILGKSYILDWSATDIDGDSLVYSLVKPIDPIGTIIKPFELAELNPGYKMDSNIANGSPDFSINPNTGLVNYKPMVAGNYLICVRVDEYRNGVKIGEIRRDFAISTVFINEVAPTIVDNLNRANTIIDTIDFGNEYILNLNANDILGDSLYLKIVPNTTPGENIFDVNYFPSLIQWGKSGALQSGPTALNLILKDDTNIYAQFRWNTKCKYSRNKPYTIDFVVQDKTCPTPKYDTLHVNIFVRKQPNNPPMFISSDTSINNKVLKYYVKQNTLFSLNGDSILKTYDKDSSQVVNIIMMPDPVNPSNANNNLFFSATPGLIHSTAVFSWNVGCNDKIDTVYKVKFVAYDDDCLKKDSAFLQLEIYVLPDQFVKETICGVTVDSIQQWNIIFWNGLNTNASNYLIYRYHDVTSQYLQLAAIPAGTSNFYLDNSSNSNFQEEKYKIVAFNSCGQKSVFSDVVGSIYLEATENNNTGLADLKWNKIQGSINDSIQVFYESNFISKSQIIATLPISDTSYSTSNIFMGTNKYRVDVKFSDTCYIPPIGGQNFKVSSNISLILSGSVSGNIRYPISIRPNPTNNTISITGLPENEQIDLEICDIQGKVVISKKYLNAEIIDLSELSIGVYLVKVDGMVQKVVKM